MVSTVDTAYHPDFGQPVSYRFEGMPEDDDAQVRMTIRRMCGLALEQSSSPVIQEDAAAALARGGGDPIQGVWATVKPYIRFRQDFDTAQDLQVEHPWKKTIVETIIEPIAQSMMIRSQGKGVGDCDCFEVYAACLLVALGVPVSFCTVAAERGREWAYSHVYLVAYPNGKRIPLDFSHGAYPGWECPNYDRLREWPVGTETMMPSMLWPLLLAAAGGYFLLRSAR